jgi:hypothetical protein
MKTIKHILIILFVAVSLSSCEVLFYDNEFELEKKYSEFKSKVEDLSEQEELGIIVSSELNNELLLFLYWYGHLATEERLIVDEYRARWEIGSNFEMILSSKCGSKCGSN